MYSDLDIRKAFTDFHRSKNLNSVLKHELRISSGYAVADIVSISDFLIGYEIKSDLDNVGRLASQVYWYDRAFRKSHLITTRKKYESFSQSIPLHWGILIYDESFAKAFKQVRAAKMSPNYSLQVALRFLWKAELETIVSERCLNSKRKNRTRNELIELICGELNVKNISQLISRLLENRFKAT